MTTYCRWKSALRITVVALLLAAILPAWAPPASAGGVAILQVTGKAAPAAVLPESMGRIDVTMANVGNVTAFAVDVEVTYIDEPLVILGLDKVRLGGLGAGESTTASPFRFHVPGDTEPGTYQVRLLVRYNYVDIAENDERETLSLSLPVTVSSAPTLFVTGFSPDSLEAGTRATVGVTLTNHGPGRFVNVLGNWSSAEDVLLPVGSSNTFHIASLGPGNETTIPFTVYVDDDAKAGSYPVTFRFTYRDAAGSLLTDTATVGVEVRQAARHPIQVTIQDIDKDSLTLAITNSGTKPLTAVQLTLSPGDGLQIDAADTIALGALLAGEFKEATFDVERPRSDAPIDTTVQVTYTDENGQRHTSEHTVQRAGTAPAPPPSPGTIAGAAVTSVVLIAGIVTAIILITRRAKERRARAAKEAQDAWQHMQSAPGPRGDGDPDDEWRT